MEDRIAQSAQTGAFTLMLLIKNYRSQMIALLLKNGVAVPSGASDKQILNLMANLLKISKSFYRDIMLFLQNPKVLNNLAGEFSQNAQYFRADGFAGKKQGNAQYFRADGYLNYTKGRDRFSFDDISLRPEDEDENGVETTETTKTPKKGFFSGLNLGELIKDGLGAFVTLDSNRTDRIIAEARKNAGLPPLDEETYTDEDGVVKKKERPDDEGISATTIVVLSLVGIAVIGTIIYFVTRPKKV
jgi:hypothetical protein